MLSHIDFVMQMLLLSSPLLLVGAMLSYIIWAALRRTNRGNH